MKKRTPDWFDEWRKTEMMVQEEAAATLLDGMMLVDRRRSGASKARFIVLRSSGNEPSFARHEKSREK